MKRIVKNYLFGDTYSLTTLKERSTNINRWVPDDTLFEESDDSIKKIEKLPHLREKLRMIIDKCSKCRTELENINKQLREDPNDNYLRLIFLNTKKDICNYENESTEIRNTILSYIKINLSKWEEYLDLAQKFIKQNELENVILLQDILNTQGIRTCLENYVLLYDYDNSQVNKKTIRQIHAILNNFDINFDGIYVRYSLYRDIEKLFENPSSEKTSLI